LSGPICDGVDFTYTRNRNKIKALHEDIERYNLYESATFGNTRVGTVAFVGEEWGVLYSDSAPSVDPETGMKLLQWNNTYVVRLISDLLSSRKLGI
jgi:iron complex outermembrane recepter protein